jgi:signal recognition particle subunit SRP72
VRGSQGAIVREKHESSTFGANSNASNSKSNQASTSKEASHNVVAEQPKPSKLRMISY